ncbi:class I SAM-dependent methyltransferase [Candidatus Micrarchaeota archaeon]|nr:class I SAM-dependent methyltransferase [Candidatus Micrarchaeota archaeon]
MQDFEAWNERMFRKYNNVRLYRHPNPFIRFIESERVRLILSAITDAERVVDVGCGEGYVLSRIPAKVRAGVDISETAVKEASRDEKAIIVRSYAESTPFTDSYFDAAVCSEVLEHTEKPEAVVRELARIVRPGGTVVLSVPNEPLINRIKDIVWSLGLFSILFPGVPRRQNDEWHLHSFDRRMLESACEAGALGIERIHSVPVFFLPVRYVAVCRNAKDSPSAPAEMFGRRLKRKSGYFDATG